MDSPIYLDHNATTPCDSRVIEAMLPHLGNNFANPTSRSHQPGREAFMALETARRTVASMIGARSATEVVFTSGATEANNLAILGLNRPQGGRGRHLVTQATEHASVLEPARALAASGWELSLVEVDSSGRIRLDELERTLRDDTALLSLMLANNETGTIQPLHEAIDLARRRGVPVHCDAAQAVGKILVDVCRLGVDLLSFSAHKVYGPKGIGALYISRRGPKLKPVTFGGGQEGGLRPGTVNVAAVVGMARALELAADEGEAERDRLTHLRDRLEAGLADGLTGCRVNGDLEHRLAGTTNILFGGVDAEALLASLPGIALSTGSACTSSRPQPSPVLRAMGLSSREAASCLRFGLGRRTTEQEIDRVVDRLVHEVSRLRQLTDRDRR